MNGSNYVLRCDYERLEAERDALIAKMNYCRQIIDADEKHGEDRLALSKMVHNVMVELDEYRDGEHEKIVALKAERDAAIAKAARLAEYVRASDLWMEAARRFNLSIGNAKDVGDTHRASMEARAAVDAHHDLEGGAG